MIGIRMETWGDYACFTRPEMKVERVTYDVMTPSAARGIVEAVYYHPGLTWIIDKIHVLNPIRTENIRRNEVGTKISARAVGAAMRQGSGNLYLAVDKERQQRSTLLLKDVHYVIEAHFVMTDKAAPGDNPGKFLEITRRRLQKGQCFQQPCFGCREYPAQFREWEGNTIPSIPETRDLGYMLYDMDYSDPRSGITPLFFHAIMTRGTIDLTDVEVLR